LNFISGLIFEIGKIKIWKKLRGKINNCGDSQQKDIGKFQTIVVILSKKKL
jgi:hypothetical protein